MPKTELTENWVDVAGARTRYLSAGSGEPIVFVHGGFVGDNSVAESAEIWTSNLTALGARYNCIAVDRLGQGQTANPLTSDGYTIAASIEHLIEFFQTLGLGPCHLVGHSFGAVAIAEVTLRRPDLVRSCTICSSDAISPRPGDRDFVLATNPHAPLTRQAMRHWLETACFNTEAVTAEWVERSWLLMNTPKLQEAAEKVFDGELYESRLLPEMRTIREKINLALSNRSIGRPTMLCVGFHDKISPIDLSYDLYDRIACHELHSRMHVMGDSGNYPFVEQTDVFNRLLVDFVEDIRHGA